MTALMAWPNFHREMEAEVDNQVAAPAATRTPNLHRANKIAHRRVRMEGWRQGCFGRKAGTAEITETGDCPLSFLTEWCQIGPRRQGFASPHRTRP